MRDAVHVRSIARRSMRAAFAVSPFTDPRELGSPLIRVSWKASVGGRRRFAPSPFRDGDALGHAAPSIRPAGMEVGFRVFVATADGFGIQG